MSEETKNKALELSDEEMDKIAGGKITIITAYLDQGQDIGYSTCNNGSVSYGTFSSCLKSKHCCDSYNADSERSKYWPNTCAACTWNKYGVTSTNAIESWKNEPGTILRDMNGCSF